MVALKCKTQWQIRKHKRCVFWFAFVFFDLRLCFALQGHHSTENFTQKLVPTTSVIQQNAETLSCCEAPEMFRGWCNSTQGSDWFHLEKKNCSSKDRWAYLKFVDVFSCKTRLQTREKHYLQQYSTLHSQMSFMWTAYIYKGMSNSLMWNIRNSRNQD